MIAAYMWIWKVAYARAQYVHIYGLCDASNSTGVTGVLPSFSLVTPLGGKRGQKWTSCRQTVFPKQSNLLYDPFPWWFSWDHYRVCSKTAYGAFFVFWLLEWESSIPREVSDIGIRGINFLNRWVLLYFSKAGIFDNGCHCNWYVF